MSKVTKVSCVPCTKENCSISRKNLSTATAKNGVTKAHKWKTKCVRWHNNAILLLEPQTLGYVNCNPTLQSTGKGVWISSKYYASLSPCELSSFVNHLPPAADEHKNVQTSRMLIIVDQLRLSTAKTSQFSFTEDDTRMSMHLVLFFMRRWRYNTVRSFSQYNTASTDEDEEGHTSVISFSLSGI